MSLNPIFTGLAGGIQSLSALLTIITSDGIEQQILDHSSGPVVMGASMLGSSGQLGVVRAAMKIFFGLSRVSKAKIDVKDLKHISDAAVDSTGYGVTTEYGLNPRFEQPLLADFMKNRDWPVWFYFGMRPSKEQDKMNKRINYITFFCFAIASLLTGTTAIPICIGRRHFYWILTMLNPLGLLILAFAFVRIRGDIRRRDEQDIEIGYQVMKPRLAFIGSSMGFIDSRALEIYPAERILIRFLLAIGSACVLVGFVASYAFFQQVKTRYAYIWIGMQVFLLVLRYSIWFIRPFRSINITSTEMGCRAKRVISNLKDLKSEAVQKFILCIAAARLKEVGHELKLGTVLAADKILPRLNIDETMFRHQDLTTGDNSQTGGDDSMNTCGDETLNMSGDNTLDKSGDESLNVGSETIQSYRMGNVCGESASIELILLPWAICYAISRAMGILPASEPWTGRHHRLCAILRKGGADIVVCMSIETMAQEPDQSKRKYILIGEKANEKLDLCSKVAYGLRTGESLTIVDGLNLTDGFKEELFADARKYLNSVKQWRDNLIEANNTYALDQNEHLSGNPLRRLIVRNANPLDITIGSTDRQVEQYWRCIKLD